MVVVIVVMAFALPALLRLLGGAAWNAGRTQAFAGAALYAQGLMEEIRTKKYDELAGTYSSTLGPESGETYPAGYDDVDDYNGYSDIPAGGFTRTVTVGYVYLNGTAWTDCGAQTCVAATTCTTCSQCCYKKITVTVSRNDNLVKNLKLVAIVGAH